MKLEKKLSNLQSRKDRLLGLNARLAASFSSAETPNSSNTKIPLSQMLSRLNKKETPNEIEETNTLPSQQKKTPVEKHTKESENNVSSPDLALLAAASAKVDCRSPFPQYERLKDSDKNGKTRTSVLDEKPPIYPSPGSGSAFISPNTRQDNLQQTLLNGTLHTNHRIAIDCNEV